MEALTLFLGITKGVQLGPPRSPCCTWPTHRPHIGSGAARAAPWYSDSVGLCVCDCCAAEFLEVYKKYDPLYEECEGTIHKMLQGYNMMGDDKVSYDEVCVVHRPRLSPGTMRWAPNSHNEGRGRGRGRGEEGSGQGEMASARQQQPDSRC